MIVVIVIVLIVVIVEVKGNPRAKGPESLATCVSKSPRGGSPKSHVPEAVNMACESLLGYFRVCARQGKARQDKTGHDKTRQDMTRQGKI